MNDMAARVMFTTVFGYVIFNIISLVSGERVTLRSSSMFLFGGAIGCLIAEIVRAGLR